jgi:hypothetical protein
MNRLNEFLNIIIKGSHLHVNKRQIGVTVSSVHLKILSELTLLQTPNYSGKHAFLLKYILQTCKLICFVGADNLNKWN